MSREIPLSGGLVTTVDDEDYDRVLAAGPWHADHHAHLVYAARNVQRPDGSASTQRLHTFLMSAAYVDHHDHNGLNNRRSNLRPASQSQNIANARRRRDNTSGFRGVTFNRRARRWAAQITVDQKTRGLGYFSTAEEAARAYDVAAVDAWGDFARPNFPAEVSA
jgi:hypothetical protein